VGKTGWAVGGEGMNDAFHKDMGYRDSRPTMSFTNAWVKDIPQTDVYRDLHLRLTVGSGSHQVVLICGEMGGIVVYLDINGQRNVRSMDKRDSNGEVRTFSDYIPPKDMTPFTNIKPPTKTIKGCWTMENVPSGYHVMTLHHNASSKANSIVSHIITWELHVHIKNESVIDSQRVVGDIQHHHDLIHGQGLGGAADVPDNN